MNLDKPLPHEEDEEKDGLPGESFEELRDSEYEENLDEYGDGNETDDWPSGKKAASEEEEEEI